MTKRPLVHCSVLLLLTCLFAQAQAACVWLEGESPTVAPAPVAQAEGEPVSPHKTTALGKPDVLSGGNLLMVQVEPGEVEKLVPPEGLVYGWEFTTATAGPHEVWMRIGPGWARADFDWRLDGGAWRTHGHLIPTRNPQELATWNEQGWAELGKADLAAGAHKLELRLPRVAAAEPKPAKGKPTPEPKGDEAPAKPAWSRLLLAIDAICVSSEPFRPYFRHKPGEYPRSADDLAAWDRVVPVAMPADAAQARTRLDGLWSIAPWDDLPWDETQRLEPVRALPADLGALHWTSMRVPGYRMKDRPDLSYTHRYLLRTRFRLPAEAKGRSAFLDFQHHGLITSVFVNGRYCDASANVGTAWQCDISPALKTGENELVVAVKDIWYALRGPAKEDSDNWVLGGLAWRSMPLSHMNIQSGGKRMDMPVSNSKDLSGLQAPVELVLVGPVYTDDAFVRPSVAKKELAADLVLRNPGTKPMKVRVRNEIVPWNRGQGGAVAKRLPDADAEIAPGATASLTVRDGWADPRLWWPDDPQLYWLRTVLEVDGKAVDERLTRFGFRDFAWDGPVFRLNGVRWQAWADMRRIASPKGPADFLEMCRATGINSTRYWKSAGWGPMSRRETLDFFDEQGILIRTSGVFDGQVNNYGFGLTMEDPDGKPDANGKRPRRARTPFFDAWRSQMAAWVRAERNHPCVFVWSIENEITYINLRNLHQYNQCEPEIRKGAEVVMALDPTRPAMVDGGEALMDQSLPINGSHYTELYNSALRGLPDCAYDKERFFQGKVRDAWAMHPQKPIFLSEVYFAQGYSPGRFAAIGGDRCFLGIGETMPTRDLMARMFSEGFRWCGIPMWHFWTQETGKAMDSAIQPVALLCRQWDRVFAPGATVRRDLKLFNQTSSTEPLTAVWEWRFEGAAPVRGERVFSLAPGGAEEFAIESKLPTGKPGRTEGALVLTVGRAGKDVYRAEHPACLLSADESALPTFKAGELCVLDPSGNVAGWLAARKVVHTAVKDAEAIPDSARVVLLGPGAIRPGAECDRRWFVMASRGQRVLVMNQELPLRWEALPADLKPTDHTGRIAFPENLEHPVFHGLRESDFFTWGADHVVYRNAYAKGMRGFRSLLQCDDNLGDTILAECQVEDGVLLLDQTVTAEKLGRTPVADRLFCNLLGYAAAYTAERKPAYACLPEGDSRKTLLEGLQLAMTAATGPLDTLQPGAVAVVDATPANLKILAGAKEKVDAFCATGGWLVLWGLTPEGLADYNRVVGFEHLIRPFRREKVSLASPMDPLAAGISLRDVAMDTGEKIFKWKGLTWPVDDTFTHVVDLQDVAPFVDLPTPQELGKEAGLGFDHQPKNLMDGFVAEDSWIYTYMILLDRGHSRRIPLRLPREEELVALRIRPANNYHVLRGMDVYFDGDPTPAQAEFAAEGGVQECPVAGRRSRNITLDLARWDAVGSQNVLGIEDLSLIVKRSPEFLAGVKPLLNIGAMVRYPRGKGGIFLCQVKLSEKEYMAVNRQKKTTMVKTVLANMGAQFAGGKTLIPGASVSYKPLRLPDTVFNTYISGSNSPAWFASKEKADLGKLPCGDQTFAAVDYHLQDFATSPIPAAIVPRVKGKNGYEVLGIPVNAKADALFFLQTASIQRRLDVLREAREAAKGRKILESPVMAHYVVHYQGGATVEIPLRIGEEMGQWLLEKPASQPGAALAWTGDVEGSPLKTALYSMQWNNPRPEDLIESVDLVTTLEVPESTALLAITVGTENRPQKK